MAECEDVKHLQEIMNERDRRYQERFEASQKALEAAMTASDRAVQAALLAAKEAVLKSEVAAEKRFELLNELRSGVATKEQLEALEKVMDDLKERVDKSSGAGAGRTTLWAALVAGIGLIVAIVVMMNVLTGP